MEILPQSFFLLTVPDFLGFFVYVIVKLTFKVSLYSLYIFRTFHISSHEKKSLKGTLMQI